MRAAAPKASIRKEKGPLPPARRQEARGPSQALPHLAQPRLATVHPTARLRTRVTLSVVSKPSRALPCLAPPDPAVPGLNLFGGEPPVSRSPIADADLNASGMNPTVNLLRIQDRVLILDLGYG